MVSSRLLDLIATSLAEDGDLAGYSGFVQDSGEGRWTVMAAIEEAVPADVLTAALYTQFRSRYEHTFAEKMLSACANNSAATLNRSDQPPTDVRKCCTTYATLSPRSPSKIFSAVIGSDCTHRPVAAAMALAIVAGGWMQGGSPTPLAP